ncbi:MAG: hypothetical protein AAF331_05650 [Pseudomonadota bacterium]
MLKNMVAAAVGIAALTVGVAQADEVWSTEIGDVIYEADLANGMAVLSYPTDGEVRGLAYIAGLAGEYTGRTGYEGIWMEPATEEGTCDIEIAAPETGEISNNWGRVKIIFVEPDFPATFVALRGDCFDEPDAMLVAKPVTAFEQ